MAAPDLPFALSKIRPPRPRAGSMLARPVLEARLADADDDPRIFAGYDPRSVERGIRYAAEGRVEIIDMGDDWASGDVAGTRSTPYQVELDWHRTARGLTIKDDCTCPLGGSCKHAVALIVEIARRYDLTLVEDDIYAAYAQDAPPPFAVLAPERTFHVSGVSKTLAPGLRAGFLVAPAAETFELAHTSVLADGVDHRARRSVLARAAALHVTVPLLTLAIDVFDELQVSAPRSVLSVSTARAVKPTAPPPPLQRPMRTRWTRWTRSTWVDHGSGHLLSLWWIRYWRSWGWRALRSTKRGIC